MEHILGQGGGSPVNMPAMSTLPVIRCSKCGGICFENVFLLRVLSAIQSPDGQEHLVPEPTFRCTGCQSILGGFGDLSNEEKENNSPEQEESGEGEGENRNEDSSNNEDESGDLGNLKLV